MIKVDVKFDSQAFEKKILETVKKKFDQHVHDRLRTVRCPVHGQAPTLEPAASSVTSSQPQFKIRGCCQALIDAATRALK